MAWTKVNKPSSTGYTRVTVPGRKIYDDVDVTYDDATVNYDTLGVTSWTDIGKPANAGATWGSTNITWAAATFTWTDPWTDVAKPS